jgi:hypothetical protein
MSRRPRRTATAADNAISALYTFNCLASIPFRVAGMAPVYAGLGVVRFFGWLWQDPKTTPPRTFKEIFTKPPPWS